MFGFGRLSRYRWGSSCGFVFRMTLHSIFMQVLRSEFEDMYDLFDIAQQYFEYVFLRFVLNHEVTRGVGLVNRPSRSRCSFVNSFARISHDYSESLYSVIGGSP